MYAIRSYYANGYRRISRSLTVLKKKCEVPVLVDIANRITSYNVCYTKLLRSKETMRQSSVPTIITYTTNPKIFATNTCKLRSIPSTPILLLLIARNAFESAFLTTLLSDCSNEVSITFLVSF